MYLTATLYRFCTGLLSYPTLLLSLVCWAGCFDTCQICSKSDEHGARARVLPNDDHTHFRAFQIVSGPKIEHTIHSLDNIALSLVIDAFMHGDEEHGSGKVWEDQNISLRKAALDITDTKEALRSNKIRVYQALHACVRAGFSVSKVFA